MEFLIQNIPVNAYIFLVMVISFMMTYWMVPKLINIIHVKNLMDDPDGRSSHNKKTPTLGGFVFFIVIMLCLFFLKSYDTSLVSFNIIPSLTILFFVGLKDDLMILAPSTKILAQMVAITFILLNPDMLPPNFYGFIGLTDIPLGFSIVFSYFIVLSIINAYNLIDGIDGLAAMIGIIIFTVFTFIFYSLQLYYYSLLAILVVGFLLAFLRYNLSSKNKIFMGDTGSMIVGLLIGIMILRFLALDNSQLLSLHIKPSNIFLLSLVILFILFMDTIRVVIIRLINKKGAFSPDRNHIHHIIIDLGISHFKASTIISFYHVFVILLFFALSKILSTTGLFIVFVLVSLFTILIVFHFNTNYSALKHKIKIRNFFVSKKNLDQYKGLKLNNSLAGIFRMFF